MPVPGWNCGEGAPFRDDGGAGAQPDFAARAEAGVEA